MSTTVEQSPEQGKNLTSLQLNTDAEFVGLSLYLTEMGKQLEALAAKEKEYAKNFSGRRGSLLFQLAQAEIYEHHLPNVLHYSFIVLLFYHD